MPRIIDDDSGVGTQVIAANLIGGGHNRMDILTSSKKGAYVHYNNSPGVERK